MEYRKTYFEQWGVSSEIATYKPDEGVVEWHILFHVEPKDDGFQKQLERICKAREALLQTPEFSGAVCVWKRFFLSDSTNQFPWMKDEADGAVSIIQQPPLDGSKVALWLYIQRGSEVTKETGRTICLHNGYRHIMDAGFTAPEGDSFRQTDTILNTYTERLAQDHISLADNCVRTWFFCRDVDTQYDGLVRGRRENFLLHGLTGDTHYISSTGIGGNPADQKALIQMDAYAIQGFEPDQQHYLYALSHLNRTIEYGVTFERGTLMQYGDRSHLFISGTASIDNQGNVLHVGDIDKQTERMWENVEQLLAEGGASFDDVAHFIVYLRDMADYRLVQQKFTTRFPHVPAVFVLAPVCRPTWLIEMECMAISRKANAAFRDF